MNKIKSNSGFTLLEVLIAIVILAGMTIAMVLSTTQIMNSKDETERLDDQSHSISLALNKISSDLQMAFLISSPDFLGTSGESKVAFVGKEDQINFPTFSLVRYFKEVQELDYGEVGYLLGTNPENSGQKILFRRESRGFDNNPEEGGIKEPLLENIKLIRFTYYDPQKKEWLKSWDSSQLDFTNRLPEMVKIEIELEDLQEEGRTLSYSTIAGIRLFERPINF